MDTTIDELRAGWEGVREQVKQLTDENRKLKAMLSLTKHQYRLYEEAMDDRDELLWWLTALANVPRPNGIPWEHYIGLLLPLRKMLATQGYTREGLEQKP